MTSLCMLMSISHPLNVKCKQIFNSFGHSWRLYSTPILDRVNRFIFLLYISGLLVKPFDYDLLHLAEVHDTYVSVIADCACVYTVSLM